MADKQKFYITTAISYPNGAPHIGHAYEVVASDAIARFKRIDGYDVFFMTGTDEHGLKIQQTADKNGTTPKAFVDEMAAKFQAMADRLDCSYDRFIRTTDADHLPSTQELWRRMQEKGDIYLSKYSGWYSVRDEAYYDESELTKQPDGSWRAPTGTPVEWIEEESYFFRLSAYQDRLLAHYEANPDFISPETRRNEIVSFVRSGLQDLSISRTTFNWGLPVPGASEARHVCVGRCPQQLRDRLRLPGRERSALALLAGGRAHHRQGHRPLPYGLLAGLPDVGGAAAAEARLRSRLPVQPRREDVEVGRQRDRSVRPRRHLRRRPAALFLHARGAVRPGRQLLPRGHRQPHQRRSGERSRQSGAALAVDDRQELRRCACRSRASSPRPTRTCSGSPTRCPAKARAAMEDFAVHTALAEIWAVVAEANRYFASQEPWVLRKSDPARMATVLYVTAEVLRAVGILAQPFVPTAAAKLLDLLAVAPEGRAARGGRAGAPPGRRDGASATCADLPALHRGGGILTLPL